MSALPASHRATMAGRVEAPDSLDYFPSPPWWGRALGRVLDDLDITGSGRPAAPGRGLNRATCEEPACGEGHLAHGLADVFGRVRASDIHDYGRGFAVHDFLGEPPPWPRPDWIATNPPFAGKTTAFIRQAAGRARIGAAMLLQLRLLEGVGRYQLFRECGLYAVAVLPRNGSGLRKGLWDPKLSTATAYGWFIFMRPGSVPGWRGFDGEARMVWVEPGAARVFTRPSDAAFAGVISGRGDRAPVRAAS